MNAKEFYKDFFGVEPKENSTTINQSVLTFAERYAKHYAAETLAELERVKEELEIAKRGGVTVKSKDAIGAQINLVIKTLRERYPKAVTNQTEDDYLRSVNFLNSLHSIVDQNRVLKGELSNYKTAYKQTLAELEKVKTTRDQYFKAAIHAQDKLTQVENESNKLRKFVKLFIETQQENYGNGIKTHLSMQTLADKAKQLLTPKE